MKFERIIIKCMMVLIFFISFSCKSKKDRRVEVITMNNTRPINELKELVLTKGDTAAYDELATAFMDKKYPEEYLLYSIIMADKYNYPRAYFQVYDCLTSAFENYDGPIDIKTKNMALTYLKKGVDLNECNATMYLSDLYMTGKYVSKDTILGKRLKEKKRKLCGF